MPKKIAQRRGYEADVKRHVGNDNDDNTYWTCTITAPWRTTVVYVAARSTPGRAFRAASAEAGIDLSLFTRVTFDPAVSAEELTV